MFEEALTGGMMIGVMIVVKHESTVDLVLLAAVESTALSLASAHFTGCWS